MSLKENNTSTDTGLDLRVKHLVRPHFKAENVEEELAKACWVRTVDNGDMVTTWKWALLGLNNNTNKKKLSKKAI